jgi:hypothetical protein
MADSWRMTHLVPSDALTRSGQAAERLIGSQRQAGMIETYDMIADYNIMIDTCCPPSRLIFRILLLFRRTWQEISRHHASFFQSAFGLLADSSVSAVRRAVITPEVKWISSCAIKPSPISATANQYGA